MQYSLSKNHILVCREIDYQASLQIYHYPFFLAKYNIVALTNLSLFSQWFQDPAEADKLLKIQRDLDETKIILVSFNSIFSDPLDT
jgi:hypothetical protein